MDRRNFLAAAGSLGAAAGTLAPLESSAAQARGERLSRAAGAGTTPDPRPAGIALAFLEGGAGLLARAGGGGDAKALAGALPWRAWRSGQACTAFPADRLAVSLGLLRAPEGRAPLLSRLEVVAHFAVEGSDEVAAFPAWRHEAGRASPPISFDACAPQRVVLQVDYEIDAAHADRAGLARAGRLLLPLGGREGAGEGLYLLAGPSRKSGNVPDFSRHAFSGDVHAPVRRLDGAPVDFDYVAVTLRPAAA